MNLWLLAGIAAGLGLYLTRSASTGSAQTPPVQPYPNPQPIPSWFGSPAGSTADGALLYDTRAYGGGEGLYTSKPSMLPTSNGPQSFPLYATDDGRYFYVSSSSPNWSPGQPGAIFTQFTGTPVPGYPPGMLTPGG